ncbi:MAG TPA: gamma-glutamyltransferase [Acidobacteria bacterium]|nr:gamma-glutamyltransferase [Acidobacteriota bacterium]
MAPKLRGADSRRSREDAMREHRHSNRTGGRAASRSVAAVLIIFMIGCASSITRDTEPGRDAAGNMGAVTAGHPLAAEAGLAVLQSGGLAMDAAITAAAVLAVARPHMNGIGGDMFLLYHDSATRLTYALNGSGKSGSAKTLEELKADGLDHMPSSGPLSVSVPGAVGAWSEALRRFGTISFAEALEPAARLAQAGLPVSERLASDIAGAEAKLREEPEAARIFLPGGRPPQPGDVLARPDLAQTLLTLQEKGAAELYDGALGRKVVRFIQDRGGLVRPNDMTMYMPEWTQPISARYQGFEVQVVPPNSQGVTLLEELAMLQHHDLAALGHNSPDYLHTISEAIRLAFVDRDHEVADPRAMRVTTDELLEPARIRQLAGSIKPGGRAPSLDVATSPDHPNTVYVIAVDQYGNVVSLIQSLFATFGSGLVVPETGIVLQNRGSLFRFEEDHPNVFAPRRRPFHTLCPVIVLSNDLPWLAVGTPGGDGQTHTLTQVINNIAVFGMTPQEAIDAPRLRRLNDGSLAIEAAVPQEVRDALAARGYTVHARSGLTAEFGGAQAVLVDQISGRRRAGADRRREGWAVAY